MSRGWTRSFPREHEVVEGAGSELNPHPRFAKGHLNPAT